MNLKQLNVQILKKARLITYAFSFLLIILTSLVYFNGSTFDQFAIANALGYLSFTYISISLAIGPFMKLWPKFELNSSLFIARRAFGVMSFVFALAHYLLQFNFLFNFNVDALIAANEMSGYGIALGFIPFYLMLALTLTSTDWAMKKLGNWWHKLHMLTYPAFFLIIAHAVKIGIDFQTGLNLYSGTFLLIALITLGLQLARMYKDKKAKKLKAKAAA